MADGKVPVPAGGGWDAAVVKELAAKVAARKATDEERKRLAELLTA